MQAINAESSYIVYADESGDTNLQSIDGNYPVFVLALCIFRIDEYINKIVPGLLRLKFKYFGHDMVVMHERDIRKQKPPFDLLKSKEAKDEFYNELNRLMSDAQFCVVAAAIKKDCLVEKYSRPHDPYELAMKFCLERTYTHINGLGSNPSEPIHFIFEKRGASEDQSLELAFRRICQGGDNYHHTQMPFQIQFADKKVNSTGLQFADLIARPIGRHVLEKDQRNRAMDIIKDKFARNDKGEYRGCGLKVFP